MMIDSEVESVLNEGMLDAARGAAKAGDYVEAFQDILAVLAVKFDLRAHLALLETALEFLLHYRGHQSMVPVLQHTRLSELRNEFDAAQKRLSNGDLSKKLVLPNYKDEHKALLITTASYVASRENAGTFDSRISAGVKELLMECSRQISFLEQAIAEGTSIGESDSDGDKHWA